MVEFLPKSAVRMVQRSFLIGKNGRGICHIVMHKPSIYYVLDYSFLVSLI
jgi:hypothetical protein